MTPTSLPTVLVTGFEPFADAPVNPSGDIVRRLVELGHPNCRLVGDVLPVSFARAAPLLATAIDAHHPDIVIALGLAESRHAITPERVAINLADARIADNDGDQPRDAEIEHGGPVARVTGLPVKAIAHALDAAGIPGDVSLTAGSYVCNQVFYELMGLAAALPGLRAGFIHVPATPQLGGSSQFTLDELERGIRIAITTTLSMHHDSTRNGSTRHDADLPGGSTH